MMLALFGVIVVAKSIGLKLSLNSQVSSSNCIQVQIVFKLLLKLLLATRTPCSVILCCNELPHVPHMLVAEHVHPGDPADSRNCVCHLRLCDIRSVHVCRHLRKNTVQCVCVCSAIISWTHMGRTCTAAPVHFRNNSRLCRRQTIA